MKKIFAHRLKTARLMSGLSQVDLANQLAVSKQAIHKYEKGLMLPDSRILILMSHILNQKPDYFTRPISVSLKKVEFRKKSVLKGSKLTIVKARIADQIERYLELEELLGISMKFANPIRGFTIENGDRIEEASLKVLKRWNLGFNPLPNVVEMLENQGVKVVEVDAAETFDGLSTYIQKNVPVIVLNRNFNAVRKRFTALHELGHLLMNLPENLPHKQKEMYCNRFAGAMLLPEHIFIKEVGKKRYNISINELVKIKEYHGISVAALVYRAKELEVINETSAKRFWKLRNSSDKRRKEIDWGNFKGSESSGRFEQLLFKALAEELVSWSKAAALANMDVQVLREQFQVV